MWTYVDNRLIKSLNVYSGFQSIGHLGKIFELCQSIDFFFFIPPPSANIIVGIRILFYFFFLILFVSFSPFHDHNTHCFMYNMFDIQKLFVSLFISENLHTVICVYTVTHFWCIPPLATDFAFASIFFIKIPAGKTYVCQFIG